MRIRKINVANFNLHDCFAQLANTQSLADMDGFRCVPVRRSWSLGHLNNGSADGYVTSNGHIKTGHYSLQLRLGDYGEIKNLSLMAKLFPKTAVTKALNMLSGLMNNLNNPAVVSENFNTKTPIRVLNTNNPANRVFSALKNKAASIFFI